MSQIENFTAKEVGIINDPFDHKCITQVSLWMMKNHYSEGFSFSASIKFVNNNTLGEQKIKGTSMDDIYNKTRDFIKTL